MFFCTADSLQALSCKRAACDADNTGELRTVPCPVCARVRLCVSASLLQTMVEEIKARSAEARYGNEI